MRVKVCGMKDATQVEQLAAAGAGFYGLIFCKGSKRFVDPENNEMLSATKNTDLPVIGVFVNENIDQLKKIAAKYNLFAVQLHGDETPDYCNEIRKTIRVIKAFRISEGENVDARIKPFMESADYFLFDNGKGGYGGTGEKFNWDILSKAKIAKPFFLSGGIGPGDVDAIKRFQHPFLFAIDINSRFEISPGNKNLDEVELFIKAAGAINEYNV
jgi:phosphoribosylanthranilate isomerase